ncbi:unnamed protein product [Thelazia callipaeda]|uniref:MAM domain-containing protein n=1 Tax=Thelazia callipaeda TaxID=103827 RepID=A0A0N5D9Z0_THECL|nr:unnamed protein product [Thelazia callipaeda]
MSIIVIFLTFIFYSDDLLQNKPIDGTADLLCYDFDPSCRWYNMHSLLIDDLYWFRGHGLLDGNRLKISTGTKTIPDGNYAIVATDHIKNPKSKATLVSDVISCQLGPAELRFMYWLSPEVRLTVCVKRTSQPYPNYDFCFDPIQNGNPGPAHISIDDMERQPFQIFIQADNFMFQSANLNGGFAIIDNIEYFGDLCSDAAVPPDSQEFTNTRLVRNEYKPMRSTDSKKLISESNYESVCDVLQCTFTNNDGHCGLDIANSMWSFRTTADNEISIEGDASNIPYNTGEGSFIFLKGPVAKSRLYSMPFQYSMDFIFVFAYYRTSNDFNFYILAKMKDDFKERIIFTAKNKEEQTRRWYRELIFMQAGFYDYVVFEIQNLEDDEYIGIDEFMVLDSKRKPVCQEQI